MGREGTRGPDSVSGIAGFALGMSYALALFSLRGTSRSLPRTTAHPFGHWFGYVVAAVFAAALLVPRLRRNPYVALFVVGIIPISIASAIAVHFGFTTHAGFAARSVGSAVGFAAEFVGAIVFLTRQKELDREVFHRAGLTALFATVGAGVAYGVAEDSFRAPHLPLTWLSLFALTVFVFGLFAYEKRYT